jgi:polyisoprenoid-binding protein YceI
MNKTYLIGSFVSLVLAASETQAAKYTIDTDHTTVKFEVAHLVVSTVEGNFTKLGGTLDFDAAAIEKSSIDAWVDVASISTDNAKRDKHLRSEDFFAAEKFPKITLKSKKIEKKSDKNFVMTGDFAMHGVTKDVAFDCDYKGAVKAWGKDRVAFKCKASILRKDFGMSFGALADATPVVGDEVEIKLTIEATK